MIIVPPLPPKRLFLAIDVPGAWCQEFKLIQNELKTKYSDVRLTPERNFHLTLCFIGDTAGSAIPGLLARLEGIIPAFKQFSIRPTRFGTFYTNRRTIFWYGATARELDRLAGKLVTLAAPETNRNFTGHITLGRINGKRIEEENIEHKPQLVQFKAEEIKLYSSVNELNGPVYQKLHSWKI